MTRQEYRAAHRAHRAFARLCRQYSLLPREIEHDSQYLPKLPEPPRSAVGQLLLDQAARRQTKLYWAGYRKRQAERDALPPIPSRIPQVPGWGRSEGARA